MTDAYAREIYSALQTHSFKKYNALTNEQWLAGSEDEKIQAYGLFRHAHGYGDGCKRGRISLVGGMDEEAASGGYTVLYSAFSKRKCWFPYTIMSRA